MPLSRNDPAFIAETTPRTIAAMERPLCEAFGVGVEAFGSKGNLTHYSGYHRSRRWILTSPDSRYGSGDYSVRHAADLSGDPDWISAYDFTPGAWGTVENRRRMRLITGRVYAAAKARDPRLANLREFAGTLDGRTVVTFNCSDGSLKAPFDSSHLDHIHGSVWRSRAADDHTGIVEVMLGIPPTTGDHDVKTLVRYSGDPSGAVFLTDFVTAKWIRSEAELNDYLTLAAEGSLPLARGAGAGWEGPVRVLGRRELIGAIVGPVPAGWGDRVVVPVPVVEDPVP